MKGFVCVPSSFKQAARSGGRPRRLRTSPTPGRSSPSPRTPVPHAATPAATTAAQHQADEPPASPPPASPQSAQKQPRPKWNGTRVRREAGNLSAREREVSSLTAREAAPAAPLAPLVDEVPVYARNKLLRCYDAMNNKGILETSTPKTTTQAVPALVPFDHNLRRRSQSSPGGSRSSPTWQVPLQTDLAKAGNNDADDWKGPIKEKATYDVGPIKGTTRLEADYSDVNRTYSRLWDNDLDIDAGSEDDIKPVPGRRPPTRSSRFQADHFENKPPTGRPLYSPSAHQLQRPTTMQGSDFRSDANTGSTEAWANSLKMRRRARTIGPSERFAGERARDREPSLGEPSLDRGTLRGSRRTADSWRGQGRATIGAWERSFGDRLGEGRFAGERAVERAFGAERTFGDRGGFEARSTSRLRGRSEDSYAFAKRSEDSPGLVKVASEFERHQNRSARGALRSFRSSVPCEPVESHFGTKLPTWRVFGIDGNVIGERDAELGDYLPSDDCKAVSDEVDSDCRAPRDREASSFRSFKASIRCQSTDSLCGGDSRCIKLRREVRGLLNKISPDNEAQIIAQLRSLDLENAKDFKTVARVTVEKAMSDPFYSEVYAGAISKLVLEFTSLPHMQTQGQSSSESDSSACEQVTGSWCSGGSREFCNFSDAVLNRCRRIFNRFICDRQTFRDGEALPREDAEVLLKTRDRARAFMRLLGHLYKVGILRLGPLQLVMDTLMMCSPDVQELGWPPKAWIECMCELILIVGKDLSRMSTGKAILKTACERLEHYKEFRSFEAPGAAKGERAYVYPIRIQYRIQDVLEANSMGWPSNPFDTRGGPARAKYRVPTRLPQPPHHCI